MIDNKIKSPYSPVVISNGLIFVSGQLPLDIKTGNIAGNDIVSQTRQVLTNMDIVLNEAGQSLASVVKTTVFLTNLDDFKLMNEIYIEYFGEILPARSCVEVSRLIKDVLIEIEAIARIL
ncbi:MAG: hypothetical protein JXN64_13885 [Spirochaetes bacterium]|nr:hypothetical protein [Spirochaetota bacterium]